MIKVSYIALTSRRYGARASICLVLVLSAYLLCAAIYAATDLASATRPGTNPAEAPWGAAVAGLRLRVTTNKGNYRLLEAVVCQIEIENTGPRNVWQERAAECLWLYTFDVVAPNGQKSPLTMWSKAIIAWHASIPGSGSRDRDEGLKPGEIRPEHPVALNRAFDMTLDGKYTVTVHRQLTNPMDNSKEITLDSNTVTIMISEPPPENETPTTKHKVWP